MDFFRLPSHSTRIFVSDFEKIAIFIPKRIKAAWEYRMNHTEHHSSSESEQTEHFLVSSASGAYVLSSDHDDNQNTITEFSYV